MKLKKMLVVVLAFIMLLVAGCQNDTELVFRNSARFLQKTEGAESRSANPFAKEWRWGNMQEMGPKQY